MKQFSSKRRGDRPIDRLRNGGGSAEIPPGSGKIIKMRGIGKRIYFVAEKAVTSAVWADEIDPERTNPNLPLMVQRVELSHGADTPFIQTTLCASFAILDQTHLRRGLDIDFILNVALRAASPFCTVSEILKTISDHQMETRSKRLDAAYLPSTPNLQSLIKQCLSHFRDIECHIKELSLAFYPKKTNKSPWDADLIFAMKKAFCDYPDVLKHFEFIRSYLEDIANHRHAAFHEDKEKSVLVGDYSLDPKGFILCPTIEIKHPKSPQPKTDLLEYLQERIDGLSHIFETLLGWLCNLNTQPPHDAFVSTVVTLPAGQTEQGSRIRWQTALRPGLEIRQNKIVPIQE